MVNRLKQQQTDKMVELLSPFSCLCSTMYRISPLDLANVLENLVEGRVINQITVPDDVKANAKLALDRMLSIRESDAGYTYAHAHYRLWHRRRGGSAAPER